MSDFVDKRLTAKEVAKLLGIHIETVYLWARIGRIPCIHLGGQRKRFKQSDIERWMSKSTTGKPWKESKDTEWSIQRPEPENLREIVGNALKPLENRLESLAIGLNVIEQRLIRIESKLGLRARDSLSLIGHPVKEKASI